MTLTVVCSPRCSRISESYICYIHLKRAPDGTLCSAAPSLPEI